MKEELNKLYHPLIIQHNNQPVSFEKREEAQFILDAYNPLCGDRFKLYFELENGQLSKMSFHGFGCAVSKASTSVLVEQLNQQSIKDSTELVHDFLGMFKRDSEGKYVSVKEDFLPFQAAKDFPGRLKCATLVWEEMHNFLLKI